MLSYQQTPEWRYKRPSTKRSNMKSFRHLETFFGQQDIMSVRRSTVINFRNSLWEVPGAANLAVSLLSVLFKHAMDMDLVEYNPTQNVSKFKTQPRRRWTQAMLDLFEREGRVHLFQAVIMGYYTGQRIGDLINLRHKDLKEDGIAIKQQKTGTEVFIPYHPVFRSWIDKWWRFRKPEEYVLRSSRNEPWGGVESFGNALRLEMDRIGIEDVTFHGLRKSTGSVLAEAGCTTEEIDAILGHTDERTSKLYRAQARRRTLSERAIERWSSEAHP